MSGWAREALGLDPVDLRLTQMEEEEATCAALRDRDNLPHVCPWCCGSRTIQTAARTKREILIDLDIEATWEEPTR